MFLLRLEALSCLPEYQAVVFKMASSSSFQIIHCRGLTDENHHRPPGVLQPRPGVRRLATPTKPSSVQRSGQWRGNEWHDLTELGSRQSQRAWTPGETLLEGEVGRRCCTPTNLPLSLESRDHSAANYLGDMAGSRFPVGLCGPLLPGD